MAPDEKFEEFGRNTACVHAVVFTPDGKSVVSASRDKSVRVWDIEKRQAWPQSLQVGGEAFALAFDRDGGSLAVGSSDGKVTVVDYPALNVRAATDLKCLGVHALAYSPTVEALVAGTSGAGKAAYVLNPKSLERIATLRVDGDLVSCLAFSPDGTTLALGNSDATVRLWSTRTWQELTILRGHKMHVTSVSYSPDGRRLASGSWDATVRIWDIASRQELMALTGHSSLVRAAVFSPSGRLLATSSWDGTVKLWSALPATNALWIEPKGSLLTSPSPPVPLPAKSAQQ